MAFQNIMFSAFTWSFETAYRTIHTEEIRFQTTAPVSNSSNNYAVFAFSYICIINYFVWYDLNIRLKFGYSWECANLWVAHSICFKVEGKYDVS